MLSAPQLLIDLAALQANYRFLRERAAPAKTAAVIKADAYGLGVAPVAMALHEAGCRHFFSAHFSEALQVRTVLRDASVAPFHGITENEYTEALAHNITPVLNSLGHIEAWSKFARRQSRELPAIIHLDTGMNRLGLPPNEQERLIANPALLDGIDVKYWASHLARAEEFDNGMNAEQLERFKSALARLPAAEASLCNSSGIFCGKEHLFDLVRPGVALYGANPTPKQPNPMQGVVELRAPILQIRSVDTNMTVGYGATHRIARKGRIATLALGYADGYLRALSGRGQVKIGSFLAPVVGRISMDLTTIDVSDVPESAAHVGALATVIGPHRLVDQVAEEAGTIPYEILTSLGPRFQRDYLKTSAA